MCTVTGLVDGVIPSFFKLSISHWTMAACICLAPCLVLEVLEGTNEPYKSLDLEIPTYQPAYAYIP